MKKILTHIIFTLILLLGSATTIQASTSVDLIDQDFQSINISVTGNVLHVTGAENEMLFVYNVTGVRVLAVKVDGSDKRYTLSMPRGCYIIKVGKLVRKISICQEYSLLTTKNSYPLSCLTSMSRK